MVLFHDQRRLPGYRHRCPISAVRDSGRSHDTALQESIVHESLKVLDDVQTTQVGLHYTLGSNAAIDGPIILE